MKVPVSEATSPPTPAIETVTVSTSALMMLTQATPPMKSAATREYAAPAVEVTFVPFTSAMSPVPLGSREIDSFAASPAAVPAAVVIASFTSEPTAPSSAVTELMRVTVIAVAAAATVNVFESVDSPESRRPSLSASCQTVTSYAPTTSGMKPTRPATCAPSAIAVVVESTTSFAG